MKKTMIVIANRTIEAAGVELITFATMFSIISMMDLATGALGLLAAWGSWGALAAVGTSAIMGFCLLATAE